jgi:copper chaperone
MSIELNVTGMTCGHCKTAVENALKQVSGVTGTLVDLANGKANIEGDHVNTDALIAAVIEEGYGANLAGA